MAVKQTGIAHIAYDAHGHPVGVSIQMSGRQLTMLMRQLELVGPKKSVVFDAELSDERPEWDSAMWLSKVTKRKFRLCLELFRPRR